MIKQLADFIALLFRAKRTEKNIEQWYKDDGK
ncbi:hypothetical protein UM89_04075 [Bacillus subtilis]|nr:hypothetical protein UM89_04075 [Bacillus subtilis]